MQDMTPHPAPRGINRRGWLHRCATTALAGSCLLQTFPDLLAAPTSRGFKIGAPDWSLGRRDVSCFQLAAQCGLDGVQLDLGTRENGMHLRRREIQQAYLKASREHRVAIGGLALGELNRTALKSEPHAAIWLHDSIAAAVELGVRIILIAQFGNGDLRGDATGVDRTIGVLKELAPRAEKAGIILGL